MRSNSPFLMELVRTIDAPCSRVFEALVDPACVAAWWAPKGWYTPHVEMDARVGGKYRFGMRSDDDPSLMFIHGEYTVIEPPHRLVFTYVWEPEGAGARWVEQGLANLPTTVTVELREVGRATELKIIHEGFPTRDGRDQHRDGWRSSFACLEDYLVRSVVKPQPRI
jgi:uncharacterized protein YndB with AHSA1/START domain